MNRQFIFPTTWFVFYLHKYVIEQAMLKKNVNCIFVTPGIAITYLYLKVCATPVRDILNLYFCIGDWILYGCYELPEMLLKEHNKRLQSKTKQTNFLNFSKIL